MCNDWHVCEHGTAAAIDSVGPTTGTYSVRYGSSFGNSALNLLRCAYGNLLRPDCSSHCTGFRVARTIDPWVPWSVRSESREADEDEDARRKDDRSLLDRCPVATCVPSRSLKEAPRSADTDHLRGGGASQIRD